MVLAGLAFYLFAFVTIASAVMVISSRNPVHAVLFLILAFFSAAGLVVLTGAEFMAMMLVVVYVGAVAVLFLFVVMMLDINFAELREGMQEYFPIGVTIGLVLFAEMVMVIGAWQLDLEAMTLAAPVAAMDGLSNVQSIGNLIYTHYVYVFQAAGMVLLVAMIGSIVLTLRVRAGVHKQVIAEQMKRTKADAVDLVKIKPGQGI